MSLLLVASNTPKPTQPRCNDRNCSLETLPLLPCALQGRPALGNARLERYFAVFEGQIKQRARASSQHAPERLCQLLWAAGRASHPPKHSLFLPPARGKHPALPISP